ncbi:lanthionine synthetase LanC family protein [Saccharothrix xinjiangensis]|uniref:Lanthionine synthetase LanC family protein n=1 Tax=Saccharothrix xinjiangensis TaxID=204798 RepID=A0ABV9XWG0_9PSEU
MLTFAEHRTGRFHRPSPQRPSWCYGTPGIARARQLVAIATSDARRRHPAETALLNCLHDLAQTTCIAEADLCHGLGGFRRAADDATHRLVHALAAYLARHISRAAQPRRPKNFSTASPASRRLCALANP